PHPPLRLHDALPILRKPYAPGAHGPNGRRRALSEFGVQLKEKQKFKLSYGIDERNLRQVFKNAKRAKGSTSQKFLELLERRLDKDRKSTRLNSSHVS